MFIIDFNFSSVCGKWILHLSCAISTPLPSPNTWRLKEAGQTVLMASCRMHDKSSSSNALIDLNECVCLSKPFSFVKEASVRRTRPRWPTNRRDTHLKQQSVNEDAKKGISDVQVRCAYCKMCSMILLFLANSATPKSHSCYRKV